MTKNEEDEASLLDGEILGDGDEDDQQFREQMQINKLQQQLGKTQ